MIAAILIVLVVGLLAYYTISELWNDAYGTDEGVWRKHA